jgi:hypothetical protein
MRSHEGPAANERRDRGRWDRDTPRKSRGHEHGLAQPSARGFGRWGLPPHQRRGQQRTPRRRPFGGHLPGGPRSLHRRSGADLRRSYSRTSRRRGSEKFCLGSPRRSPVVYFRRATYGVVAYPLTMRPPYSPSINSRRPRENRSREVACPKSSRGPNPDPVAVRRPRSGASPSATWRSVGPW